MARVHIDNIVIAFTILESKIKLYSHLNLQDINIIYSDRKFVNLNTEEGNFTSIDLGDDINDIAFQVTCTTTAKKVNDTILKY